MFKSLWLHKQMPLLPSASHPRPSPTISHHFQGAGHCFQLFACLLGTAMSASGFLPLSLSGTRSLSLQTPSHFIALIYFSICLLNWIVSLLRPPHVSCLLLYPHCAPCTVPIS